jgi:hypothetical protein
LDRQGRLRPHRIGAAGGQRRAIEIWQHSKRGKPTASRSHSRRATGPSSTGRSGTAASGPGSSVLSGRLPGLPVSIFNRVGLGLRPRISFAPLRPPSVVG